LKVESKNIAIIPRQGFGDIAKILGNPDSYTAVITGQENIGKSLTQVVSLIPVADTGDLLLSKLWIDPAQKLVLKTQLTTRSNGTMLIEYVYGSQAANGLPDKIIFTVDMKKFNLPRILTSEANEPVKPKQQQEKAQKKGVIEVTFTNYRVNQGIKDSVFRQN
jgi:outer membrane lipoprotein-sorting protein